MFVKSTLEVGVTQRVVTTLVACAVVTATIGFHQIAQAANLTNISDTLTDSAPSETSGHTIQFTVPVGSVGIAPADNITVTFDSQDDGTVGQSFVDVANVLAGDVTVTVDGVASGAFVSATADTIVVDGATAVAGQVVEIVVADGVITNPAKVNAAGVGDSYEIEVAVANADADLGRTRVAIVDNVLVTAIVDTVFEFVVTGLATSTDVNGETTTGSTTATTIDYAQLVAGVPEVLGQKLNVTTNAINGFVVTVEQDQNLLSSTGADIDGFTDGTYVDTPTAWVPPTGTLAGGENEWGHWGLTSEDSDLNTDEFGTQLFVAASTTPRQIFSHDGPTDGVTADVGETEVAYKIEITSFQEAGDDYNTILTYIATPTF